MSHLLCTDIVYEISTANFFSSITAIPDDLLVARAVVRRKHKDLRNALRRNILETPFHELPLMKHLSSFLSDRDEEKIDNLIKRNERIEASDYLLSILIANNKPGWFEGLWMSLCQHGEFDLAESLVKAQDDILSEEAFKSIDASTVLAIKDSVNRAKTVSWNC